jgi:hypothetical protein
VRTQVPWTVSAPFAVYERVDPVNCNVMPPSVATDAYCPHCGLPVETQSGPSPTRCPHCRLLIGPGRTRREPGGEPGTKGAAAGVLSRQARRDDSEGVADEAAVLDAIRRVAAELGTRPERLLMVDYQQRADSGADDLPPLRDVFAHFRSWKRARRVAAESAASAPQRADR